MGGVISAAVVKAVERAIGENGRGFLLITVVLEGWLCHGQKGLSLENKGVESYCMRWSQWWMNLTRVQGSLNKIVESG